MSDENAFIETMSFIAFVTSTIIILIGSYKILRSLTTTMPPRSIRILFIGLFVLIPIFFIMGVCLSKGDLDPTLISLGFILTFILGMGTFKLINTL